MKLILIIISTSILFSQQKKIKFDPNKLIDPTLNWPKIISPFNSDTLNSKETTFTDSIIIVEGFRVQVLATRDRFNAEKLQSELGEKIQHKIYVIFEAPNYKVRIGNFIDRRKAENFRIELAKNGYSSAWIIRTKIDPIK
jgi:hypothetical protein|tara:strand:+ start:258 stop:677 length:420 start_codon:yes stop_codon:yes gene_type:complete